MYFNSLGDFQQHVNKYLDLYEFLYLRCGRDAEAAAISEQARERLAEEIPHQDPWRKRIEASVRLLLQVYERCELEQRKKAIDDLRDWAEYLRCHRARPRLLGFNELWYEAQRRDATKSSASVLWSEYQKYLEDPRAWAQEYDDYIENQHKERRYQIWTTVAATEARRHLAWLQANQPNRVLGSSQLRPQALEFTPNSANSSPAERGPASSGGGSSGSRSTYGVSTPNTEPPSAGETLLKSPNLGYAAVLELHTALLQEESLPIPQTILFASPSR